MKTIKKNELFDHMSVFLKERGIELKEGSYTDRIRKGCELLAEVINCTERGIAEAAAQMDQGLERMRDIIHRKTAPKRPPAASPRAKSKGSRRPKSARKTQKA
ncbi:MAG: hypothetical protein QHJ82_12860 [Verrucomicrobiota bacterium]|nr:hypothetical protein [Verrucomicrobiota bacterium]